VKRALIFDSGVGGLSVLDAIVAAGLALELDYAADNAWLPYGLRSSDELAARVPALIAALARESAPDIVVLACNTASTAALAATRAAISVPVVGVVPPIKPAAAASRSGTIGLLATPATVSSAYVDDLISEFAAGVRVVRYGSSALVAAAEAKLAGAPVDAAAVDEAIGGLFGAPGGAGVDVVALACTHFPLLAGELAAAAPRACLWLDSGAAIARRVSTLLQLEHGGARLRRAAFSDAQAGARVAPAFRARGFAEFARLSVAPDFAPAPL
jgi:glutamate racemase